jgi:hypothetical protein
MLLMLSCKKERSFDPDGNTGGGGTSNGTLLARTVTKFGSDSVATFYEYDSQKRLTVYKTGGTFLGSSVEVEIKFVRNSQGIIEKSILKTDFFASMGIDSVVRNVHYNVANSQYTSMVAAYFDGVDNIIDSIAFTYNTGGKIAQVEYFFDDGSGYIKEEKTEYAYDANDNVQKEKNYTFNPASSAYEAYDESIYEFDSKTNPIFLGNEGFILGDIITYSPHNQLKKTYTDLTDPSQNAIANSTYSYNSAGKPASVTQNQTGIPVPFVTTYYYK